MFLNTLPRSRTRVDSGQNGVMLYVVGLFVGYRHENKTDGAEERRYWLWDIIYLVYIGRGKCNASRDVTAHGVIGGALFRKQSNASDHQIGYSRRPTERSVALNIRIKYDVRV